MMSFTYALVLFFTVFLCFFASFHKNLRFDKHFLSVLKAGIIVGIPFIIWDIWFTQKGVWWFDYDYTLGLIIGGLPIEEYLFFICIPFSRTFTYYCIDKYYDLSPLSGFNNIISFVTVITCSVVALIHYDKAYTLLTALLTVLTLIFLQFVAKVNWIGGASFVFVILMLGFLPANGVLTGTGLESPLVNYNPNEFLGIRIGTIPIEDAVYGYTQFLWILYFFKFFYKRRNLKNYIDYTTYSTEKNCYEGESHIILVKTRSQTT